MSMKVLSESRDDFKEIVSLTYPVFEDMPVVIGSKPNSKSTFSAHTDNRSLFVNVNDPNKLEAEFQNFIVPKYQPSSDILYGVKSRVGNVELQPALEYDFFMFLFGHELFHPRHCPVSKEDQRQISKSLYQGIREVEPSLTPKEALFKVNNCKNLIWDVVVNTNFINKTGSDDALAKNIKHVFEKNDRKVGNQKVKAYPSGIGPIPYIISAEKNTTDKAISLMGTLYSSLSFNDKAAREEALQTFAKDLDKKGMSDQASKKRMNDIYLSFVSELKAKNAKEAGIDIKEYTARAQNLLDPNNADHIKDQKYVLDSLVKIFDTSSLRYDSLKGLAKTMSDLISMSQKVGSPDPNTSGYGDGHAEGGEEEDTDGSGSMSDTLDDLLGSLDGKDADDLLDDLTKNPYGSGRRDPQSKAKSALGMMAVDEFYKKNADVIELHGSRTEYQYQDIGMKKKWKIKSTKTLTEAELSRLDINKMLAFQEASGLRVLTRLDNGYYKLNEWKTVETNRKSSTLATTGIEIPDNWIPIIDSSSSMTPAGDFVGSGNKYDTLMRVLYGIENGLYKVCKDMKKDLNYGVVNFSDATQYRGMDSFIKVHESRSNDIKKVKLEPQCGSTYLDNRIFSRIRKDLKPGKTVFTQITDGQIFSDTDRLYNIIDAIGRQKDNAYLFMEIANSSELGSKLSSLSRVNKGVQYYHVNNVKDIKDKMQSVLINYT